MPTLVKLGGNNHLTLYVPLFFVNIAPSLLFLLIPDHAPTCSQSQALNMPQHPIVLRVQALALLTIGVPESHVSEITGIPPRTLRYIRKKAHDRGFNPSIDGRIQEFHVADGQRTGRPKENAEDRELERLSRDQDEWEETCAELSWKTWSATAVLKFQPSLLASASSLCSHTIAIDISTPKTYLPPKTSIILVSLLKSDFLLRTRMGIPGLGVSPQRQITHKALYTFGKASSNGKIAAGCSGAAPGRVFRSARSACFGTKGLAMAKVVFSCSKKNQKKA